MVHGALANCFLRLGVNTAENEKGALAAGQGPADPLTDARLLEDVQFSMLKGQRYKASCQMLTDDVRMRTLLFLAIAIEPLRYLSGWWMRRAREADRHPCKMPAFLDILHPRASCLWIARQYLATLLHSCGGQGRLARALLKTKGFEAN